MKRIRQTKTSFIFLVISMVISAPVFAAKIQPPDKDGPCSPTWHGPPPIIPCDFAKNPPGQGNAIKHERGHPAGKRLYPAPDGKGDACTVPWQSGPTGKPYCRGEIIEGVY